jgi:hypothetical protein
MELVDPAGSYQVAAYRHDQGAFAQGLGQLQRSQFQ